MNLEQSDFLYSALLKHDANELTFEGLELFPGLNEISFASRHFSNYAECVKSCKGMMTDLSEAINRGINEPSKYKVGAEVNPVVSGSTSVSKDWTDTEVARFWVYDRNTEGKGSAINAVCKGSIYAVPRKPSTISVN